jgi:CheY-like chemotaxis protein
VILPAPPAIAAEPASPSETALPRGRGETVLIVDDEENVRNAARTLLELNGYRTILAANGIEALALYAKPAIIIDAVLANIAMPVMDGLTLIAALRRMRPGLPVIVSTGEGDGAHHDEMQSLDLEPILQKPYTAGLLLRALDSALGKGRLS